MWNLYKTHSLPLGRNNLPRLVSSSQDRLGRPVATSVPDLNEGSANRLFCEKKHRESMIISYLGIYMCSVRFSYGCVWRHDGQCGNLSYLYVDLVVKRVSCKALHRVSKLVDWEIPARGSAITPLQTITGVPCRGIHQHQMTTIQPETTYPQRFGSGLFRVSDTPGLFPGNYTPDCWEIGASPVSEGHAMI